MRSTTFGRRTGLRISQYALGPDDYLAALSLTDEQYDRLDEISAIDLGISHQSNAKVLNGLQGDLAGSLDGPVVPVS